MEMLPGCTSAWGTESEMDVRGHRQLTITHTLISSALREPAGSETLALIWPF